MLCPTISPQYCRGACRQEAYRERKEAGHVSPEAELTDLRTQIGVLVSYAEYQGAELPTLGMLQDIQDPDLKRIGLAIDQLQMFRIL